MALIARKKKKRRRLMRMEKFISASVKNDIMCRSVLCESLTQQLRRCPSRISQKRLDEVVTLLKTAFEAVPPLKRLRSIASQLGFGVPMRTADDHRQFVRTASVSVYAMLNVGLVLPGVALFLLQNACLPRHFRIG